MEQGEHERLFLAHVAWIERVAAGLCRRHGISEDDADDAVAWIKLRLMEDDYAPLRHFRGESSMTTYLAVVVSCLFRDYRTALWGRWRPSAEARRRGAAAVRLEALVGRDGYSVKQAAELLRTRGEAELTDYQCASLLAQLPARAPLRPVELTLDAVTDPQGPGGTDDSISRREAQEAWREADQALESALARLPAEDRLILRLRFWDALSVAEIARGLALPQKPLYRRIERALGEVRRHLEAAGLTTEEARELLNTGALNPGGAELDRTGPTIGGDEPSGR